MPEIILGYLLALVAAGIASGIVGLVTLDADGAVGDRRWCFVDPLAARVLRTVQHPSLMQVVAEQVLDLQPRLER